jgi:ribosomal protein L7Ae-like RNA K-turn-binding protein
MLDYAANGTEYWSIDRLRQAAAETASDGGQQLDELLGELIDADTDEAIESYWQKVEHNLQSGKVRLIFAADSTPKELRRLVEFLNEKMNDVEVLIVEVKQYLSAAGQKAVVPRVIGLTEAARDKKGSTSPDKTTQIEFLSKCKPHVRPFFLNLISEATEKGHVLYWGTKGFSVRARLPNNKLASFVYGYPPNTFQFYFAQLPLSEDEKTALRKELMAFGLFKESGEKTLTTNMKEADLAKANEVYEFILNKIDQITNNY